MGYFNDGKQKSEGPAHPKFPLQLDPFISLPAVSPQARAPPPPDSSPIRPNAAAGLLLDSTSSRPRLLSRDSGEVHARRPLVAALKIYHEFCQHWTTEGLENDFCRKSQAWSSTVCFSDLDEKSELGDDDYTDSRRELEPQSVDPKKGWGFRGVHRAIICGKVGQVPVQKILRNGRTVTVFTVGTGGMFDQRIVGDANLPKPAQWHRIAIHNDQLGAFAVQKLVKNSAVYVEGDIETRIYNDNINDQVKNIPEICLRRDGKIRLIKSGESAASISLDELSSEEKGKCVQA
uniref:Single-stranded DNA-binding protein n=1 Tax=Leersia perrieri TaxID=77586 RepID=A0A0D9WIG4_9ORYZ